MKPQAGLLYVLVSAEGVRRLRCCRRSPPPWESHGVAREDFLKNYQGSELNPRWLNHVSKLSAKGWKSLVARDKDKVKQHRHENPGSQYRPDEGGR
jgi:Sigma-70, non-essential region